MAGSKTDYLEAELLDHVFMKGDYTSPTNIWIALFTADPSDTGGGTEVTGGSYERKQTSGTDWTRSGTSPTTMSNNAELAFVAATADWGTITAFALFDASTGGNMLYWGELTEDKDVDNGDTAKFAAGELDVTED